MRNLLFLCSASLVLAGCNCGPGSGADGGTGGTAGNVMRDGGAGGSGGATGGTAGSMGVGGMAAAGGGGGASGTGGQAGSMGMGGMPCMSAIDATVRDFSDTHPDFEKFIGSVARPGIVQQQLGADTKPVYGPPMGNPVVTSNQANFNQWYRDVPMVNETFRERLQLREVSPGRFVYDNSNFFPIDGRGFGNQGRAHNFHFTTEIHGAFTYSGGERFTFRGDDDVWVFVNKRLAVDLGGVHPALEASIDFDAQANTLGLTRGQTYTLDIFQAERRTGESNFRIETTIACFVPVEIM
jgi:fibro-slime domain-containing protein